MDGETYEALKRLLKGAKLVAKEELSAISGIRDSDITEVESWIDEVAKEYAEMKM